MPASTTTRSNAPARRAEPKRAVDVECMRELAAPILDQHGVELVELVWVSGPHGAVLRVTIERVGAQSFEDGLIDADAPQVVDIAQGGVTLDDCAHVSRDISRRFDERVEAGDQPLGDLPSFDLEVSSPGVERPLRHLADYRRFRGALAKMKLSEPLATLPSARVLRGRLLGTRGDMIVVHADGSDHDVPLVSIRDAHLVYELPQQQKPKPGKRPAKKAKGATPRPD